jgi:hypothetical protein
MDMLVNQVNGSTIGGFTPPNALDCNGSTAAPCQYAALNGFNSSILQSAANSGTIGNNVYLDFPTTAPPGVATPSSTLAPVPFIRVTVINNIQTWFAGLLGQTSQSIKGLAVCGLQADVAPIPIIVLHPTLVSSFNVQGSPNVNIIGGSSQSIQVNSCSTQNGATGNCNTNDAANFGGSANVNLCAAGLNFCGANMGVFGKEANPGNGSFTQSCVGNRPAGAPSCGGGSGTQLTPKFNSPQSPIGDPFASTAAPTNPDSGVSAGFRATPYVPNDLCGPNLKLADGVTACAQVNSVGSSGTGTCTRSDIETGQCLVDYKVHGCPDPNANTVGTAPTANHSCLLRSPGYYSQGIQAKNGVTVFDPGLYYLDPISSGSDNGYELALDSNSYVRPSFYSGGYYSVNSAGNYVAATVPSWFQYGDGGTIFYFNFPSGSTCMPKCSVHVDSNSGKNTGAPDTFGSNSYLQVGATAQTMTTCPNGGVAPSVTVPDILGNVLLAPCSLNGTWGNPTSGGGPSTTYAQYRGMLFFQDRGNNATTGNNKGITGDWGGGGQFLLAGTMYFHQCKIDTTGTDVGTGCATNTPTPFNVQFHLSGNSSNGTYVLGEIITDQLQLGGSSAISMQLDPNPANNVLKVALLQ